MSVKLTKRARLAALHRHRGADDPAVVEAAADLAVEGLAEHIARVVDTAPTLTADQISRLRALLSGPSTKDARQAG